MSSLLGCFFLSLNSLVWKSYEKHLANYQAVLSEFQQWPFWNFHLNRSTLSKILLQMSLEPWTLRQKLQTFMCTFSVMNCSDLFGILYYVETDLTFFLFMEEKPHGGKMRTMENGNTTVNYFFFFFSFWLFGRGHHGKSSASVYMSPKHLICTLPLMYSFLIISTDLQHTSVYTLVYVSFHSYSSR